MTAPLLWPKSIWGAETMRQARLAVYAAIRAGALERVCAGGPDAHTCSGCGDLYADADYAPSRASASSSIDPDGESPKAVSTLRRDLQQYW